MMQNPVTEASEDVHLNVEGMTCSNCAQNITRLAEKKGAKNIYVDVPTGEVNFTIGQVEELPEIVRGIEGLGYKVLKEKGHTEQNTHGHDHSTGGTSLVEKRFWICLIFTIPLLFHMFHIVPLLDEPSVQLILCLPVFLTGLIHFGKSAFSSIKMLMPNMDVLIMTGAIAAFIYSLIGTVQGLGMDYLFYETTASIITFVMLGNLLEHRSVRQTTSAISDLSQLQTTKAKLVASNPVTKQDIVLEIDIDKIAKGQLLLVNTGDSIPTDGEIFWGEAVIDESMVSGESIPVEKKIGDIVIGGTIVQQGNIKVRVTAIGKDTVLSQIISLVKQAQNQKPPIQKLADKVSFYFVPAVLFISMGTFVTAYFFFDISLSKALLQSIAVLVISCPCAMGLATPTAVMVGLGRAAKNGILIKGGSTLEILAGIKQIVFDKTGTITTGKFKINKIHAVNESEENIKSILVGIEKYSSHPIAQSITENLKDIRPVEFKNVKEIKGTGMQAEDESGNIYKVGSAQILENIKDIQKAGHNIYILKNNTLIGYVDIEDDIKSNAKEVINQLKKMGYKTILLSGDMYEKCKKVAEETGFDSFYAEKKPDEKLQIIDELNKIAPTAMVGDGINDAPALVKATIGISLSNATQIAMSSAQVILLNGDLSKLKGAITIGQKTLVTIRQNLFWAFFYNVLAIPIAAVGLLQPIIASLSMAFSDVIVIGNSLRLKFKKIN